MAELRATILRQLDRWRRLGERTATSGALQIGRVPHVAPEAWLHYVFAPITQDAQKFLVGHSTAYATSALRKVHDDFNGIDLFSSNFFLFGRRVSYARTVDNVQPWDLIDANSNVKAKLPDGALLVGGSHSVPHGVSFIELSGHSIVAVDKRRFDHVLFEWRTLEECILSELNRLSVLFDSQGRPVDKEALADFGARRT